MLYYNTVLKSLVIAVCFSHQAGMTQTTSLQSSIIM